MIEQIVTVFGASGFLGRNAVRGLGKGGFGYRIRAASRNPNVANYLSPMGHVGQIQLLRCDVRNADDVARAVANSDAVVNLVGILYPSGGQTYEAMHVDAARSIGRAAREAGIKTVIHISTPGISPESESAYARTKADGEIALREEFPDATILRPSLVFGPDDNFFNKFASLSRFTPALPLIGGGHTRFQPVFVGDVAKAIVKCVDDDSTRGKIYELGGPAIYTFKEMLQTILRETNRSRLLVPIPFWLATLKSYFLQFLPGTLLTPDQVTFLKSENVVSPDALTLADLGIAPDSLEAVLPSYLWRFRPKGQYENSSRERVAGTPAVR
jgi:NADH dehydrogenase